MNNEYIIETIDLELDALLAELEILISKQNQETMRGLEIQDRINTLTKFVKQLEGEK
jgi:hypothetical protein